MTKIKNTKKGMAKKTLSISLAVAMLATSNVPVWAAEDLFTDGEVAVEAFNAEEVVEEAPVVEEAEDVVDAYAEGSEYPTEFKEFKADPEWGADYTYKVKVTKDGTTPVGNTLNWRWLDEKGHEMDSWGKGTLVDTDADGYFEVTANFPQDTTGNKFMLQIYEGTTANMTWKTTSPVITVAKKAVTGTINWAKAPEADKAVVYTGKQIINVPAAISGEVIDFKNVTVTADDRAAMKFDNFYPISGDTINSVQVSGESVVAATDIISDYYTGRVEVTFDIWRKDLSSIDEIVTATPAKSTYMYTGAPLTVAGKDFTITEKLGDVIVGAASDATLDGFVGTDKDGKVKISRVGSLRNYTINGADWESEEASFKYNVVKRDLMLEYK